MNYIELVDMSKAYADRQDAEVEVSMDVFIILSESRMNRLLKTRKQSARAYSVTVTDQEYYSLPPDFAGMRDVQVNSALPGATHKTAPMDYISPVSMNIQRNKEYGGRVYYTIIADQIQIFPTLDAGQSIEMVYYQKVPTLTIDAPLNWMSIDNPDIYLAGMTGEISLFAKDYQAADGWFTRMSEAIEELASVDIVERWSGAPLQVRLER